MIVEVAYALAEKQSLISLEVKEGSTLKEAIDASGDHLSYRKPSTVVSTCKYELL